MNETPDHPLRLRRFQLLAGVAGLALLLAGAYSVLKPFLSPIVWAGVLTSTTWPLYQRLLKTVRRRQGLASALMTLLLLVAVVAPVVTASWMLVEEVRAAYHELRILVLNPPDPPAWLVNVPIVGAKVEEVVLGLRSDPESVRRLVLENAQVLQEVAVATAGRLGRNSLKLVVTLLAVFFFYRYGESILRQIRAVAFRFIGEDVQQKILMVGETVKAVVFGLLLTAIAQGVLAALGYAASGLPGPILLGVATGFLALVPFGAPLVWVPASLWLLVTGAVLPAGLLLLWCFLVVSTIDNLLRPLFISGATRIPYLLVLFGVLGGVQAFGLVGVFVGPVILAILLALWREWASEIAPAEV